MFNHCFLVIKFCKTLCDSTDCSPPGSSVHRILQAGILEWVAMPSSRGPSLPRDQTHVSYVSCVARWVLYHWHHLGSLYWSCVLATQSCPTLVTPWTVTCQAPLSMEFSRQEYWSGLPFPSPRNRLDPGIEPRSSHTAGRFFTS